jgi:hypothetical protein
MDDILHFIRDLAQRAGEGFTVGNVDKWLAYCEFHGLYPTDALYDEQGGIAAVTKRKENTDGK